MGAPRCAAVRFGNVLGSSGSIRPIFQRADEGAIAKLDGRILDFEVLNRSAKPEAVVRRIRELAPTFTPASAHSLPDLSEPASA